MNRLKEELKNAEANTSDDDKDSFKILTLKQELKETESEVNSLSDELEKGYFSLEAINKDIDSFYKKDHSGFITRVKDIAKAESATLQKIRDQLKMGAIDPKEAMQLMKNVENQARKATALVGLELTNSILNISQVLTNSILNAIETSENGLQPSMQVIGALMGQVQNMLPDPISKAVVGAIMTVFTIIDTIANYSKKKEEEARKEREEIEKKEIERRKESARLLAGETAKAFGKNLDLALKNNKTGRDLFDQYFDNMTNNKIKNVLDKLGEVKSSMTQIHHHSRTYTRWNYAKARRETIKEEWSTNVPMTINELWQKYWELMRSGNEREAKKVENEIKATTRKAFKDAGIKSEEIDALHNRIKDWNQIIIDAIKSGDFSTVGVSFKEKIRNAILDKLKDNIFSKKVNKLIDDYAKNQNEKTLNDLIREVEEATESVNKQAERLTGVLGLANSEMDEHIKNWAGMKNAITDALSSSLGDAAFNADWKSFKNAFASEMKKAIISATIATSGVKTKVDEIIKRIMKDGKITADELDSSIDELKDLYDGVEGKLEMFNKALSKLTNDGVDVNHETKGNIIQKLSGADRDFFAEQFRENFKTLAESFKSAMIDLKEIHNAQITVLQATLNVEVINIHASDNMSLKEFIGELIEQARQVA